jgi:hypothetical protein
MANKLTEIGKRATYDDEIGFDVTATTTIPHQSSVIKRIAVLFELT